MRALRIAVAVFLLAAAGCKPGAGGRVGRGAATEANRSSTDTLKELKYRMAFGRDTLDAQEAQSAAKEFAGKAGPTREAFEALLVAVRRDRRHLFMPEVAALEWADRHRGKLEFLREDVKAEDFERRYLALMCLGLIDDQDDSVLWMECHRPVWVFLASTEVERDPDASLLKPEEQARLLAKKCGLPKGKETTVQELAGRVTKTTGLPVVWYPEPANAVVNIDAGFPKWPGGMRDTRALDLLRVAATAASDETKPAGPGSQPLRYVILPARKCILMVAFPWNWQRATSIQRSEGGDRRLEGPEETDKE